MSDTDPGSSEELGPIDYNQLYGSAGTFLQNYCTATGTDRGKLDRQVVTVELTDNEGVATSMTLDLSVRRSSGSVPTFDTTAPEEFSQDLSEIETKE